jgi:hypothetical protein
MHPGTYLFIWTTFLDQVLRQGKNKPCTLQEKEENTKIIYKIVLI